MSIIGAMHFVQRSHIHQAASDSIRYMLRRWPPATLLDNDLARIRMASLLARRELSMDELADLSEQTLVRCADFLQALHEHDVLEVHEPSAAPDSLRA